ncbi:SUMF1/EgtB/PvdO family nonheme iron enzyme [Hyphobacterium sp. CCMP332]|nr:SUMF1/EgtB/PvdO family nonheme iron enzyme [Hyphobacterium sp. CCMP332]
MKKLIIILSLIWPLQELFATARPEPIPSTLNQSYSNGWYLDQYRNWRSYLDAEPEDEEAWIQTYKAAELANLSIENKNLILQSVQELHPDSKAYYYCQFRKEGWSPSGIQNLEKTLKNSLANEFPAERYILSEMRNERNRDFAERIFRMGMVLPSLLNYSYNVLMSVGDDGILFTESENSSIPLWILQDVMSVRKDVLVLNLELLENPEYTRFKFLSNQLNWENGASISDLVALNKSKDFYYALTIPQKSLKEEQDRLYVVGLTSRLSEKPFDNYSLLKQNIEERFLLDYLKVDFSGEPKYSTGRNLESNYIIPFYLLREYYTKRNETEKAEYWVSNIQMLARRSNVSARIQMLLSENSSNRNFVSIELEIKELEKGFNKIKDNIYGYETEVSNEEYELFLNYLRDHNYDDLLEKASFNLDKYDGVNKVFHRNYHYSHNSFKENFSKYPVMDLSHEAAILYCEWLTVQYNQQKGRKFNKVKFRLPTRNEWSMAALGYRPFQSWVFEENKVKAAPYVDAKVKDWKYYSLAEYDSIWYPWFAGDWFSYRKMIMNEKGCYLANIKTPVDVICPSGIKGDGFALTSPVGTYFSNDMGLYDVIGNIAEMIDEKGKAMGGSWDHPPHESTVRSVMQYEASDPRVGFRIFMEVIEE